MSTNLHLHLLLLILCHAFLTQAAELKKTFIIHMDKSNMPPIFNDHLQWYHSSLKSVSDSADILYTYNTVIHGYSAQLTPNEAKFLQNKPGILSIQQDTIYQLHTTQTPEFLGLNKDSYSYHHSFPTAASESKVIIGVLDTGIWPESPSLSDHGLGPVPATWKGTCETGPTFNSSNCNRKLIGARFFSKGYEAAAGPINETLESKSPRDDEGHGTHTATTAAGSAVPKASLLGYAPGTARGMATGARLAVYKVCWRGGCLDSDVLAGMEKAVEDGVNIMSLSLGGFVADYYRDSVAIGAFAAAAEGILVSCSAGNSGPGKGSLSNVAPWITTVGAGTIDREFPSFVTLGNGEKLRGVTLDNGKPLNSSLIPLVYAGNHTNTSNGNFCVKGSLVSKKVEGKIVVCDRGLNSRAEKGLVVESAGGVGMVLANVDGMGEDVIADAHFIPSSAVGKKAGDKIKRYINSKQNPTATISPGITELGVQPSPLLASFSSRGPNTITPSVLKPDLIAPGVEILAGWTGKVGPTELPEDTRRVSFNIISGTSMSCPHVSGIAAVIKTAHPEWSPAAIRSALMTTAYSEYKSGEGIRDVATGKPATPLDYGSGHVNPVSALDPGLVYDATVDDYIEFLCAIKYNSSMIKLITKKDYACKADKEYKVVDLNYPSFAVPLQTASVPTVVKYTRTLTNVGNPATYVVSISVSQETEKVDIVVQPEVLEFRGQNEKKRYEVTFTASSMPSGSIVFAHLEWSDGKHIVRSPIVLTWI